MWKQEKLEAQIEAVRPVKDKVVISGGFAWHFMSPDHVEHKKLHDHSDVDLFCKPSDMQEVVSTLKTNGFLRYWTKYDKFSTNFLRYGATKKKNNKRVKVLIDLFLEEVPSIKIKGFNIIEPKHLLSLYAFGNWHLRELGSTPYG